MDRVLFTVKALFGPHWPTQLFAGFFALAFGAVLARLCRIFGSNNSAIGLNVLLCVFGALLGWSVGMFFSPSPMKMPRAFSFWARLLLPSHLATC